MRYVLRLWGPVLAIVAAVFAFIGIPALIWGNTGTIAAGVVFVVLFLVWFTADGVACMKALEDDPGSKDT